MMQEEFEERTDPMAMVFPKVWHLHWFWDTMILNDRWPSAKRQRQRYYTTFYPADGQVPKDKDKDTTRNFILQMAKCQKTKTKILHEILSCRWPSARSTSTDLQEQSNATTGSAFFRFAILSFALALSYYPNWQILISAIIIKYY